MASAGIAARARGWTGRRRLIAVLAVFAAGVALRLAFLALYRPGFLGDADAGSYIFAARHSLFANVYDPVGYPLFLRLLHTLYPHLSFVIVVQHALGVASAALLYASVRRVTGSPLLGLIPAALVLFDGYNLWVEHTPISETLFTFLVTTAIALSIRGFERPGRWLFAAGAAAGVAATVRPVALLLVVLLGLWAFWRRPGARMARLRECLVLIAPACALVAVYVAVQSGATGFTGITRDGGRILYARVAGFADCKTFTPPAGTAALCEKTPPGRRGSFNQYLTGFPDGATQVTPSGRAISPAWRVFGPPPAGNAKLQAFGLAAILHQPLDYLRTVADDFHYYWSDHHRAFIAAAGRIDAGVEQAVFSYYATGPGVHSGGIGFLSWYGRSIEITGPLMIVLLLAPLIGVLAEDRRARAVVVLFALTGWLLPLGSDALASVDPRFMLPSYGPLAGAAAIGLGSPRGRRMIQRFRPGRRARSQ